MGKIGGVGGGTVRVVVDVPCARQGTTWQGTSSKCPTAHSSSIAVVYLLMRVWPIGGAASPGAAALAQADSAASTTHQQGSPSLVIQLPFSEFVRRARANEVGQGMHESWGGGWYMQRSRLHNDVHSCLLGPSNGGSHRLSCDGGRTSTGALGGD
jgi:hypothetical protein